MRYEKEIQRLIEKLLAGQINQSELDRLEGYASQYPEYRDLIQTHKRLTDMNSPIPEPDTALYHRMRSEVLRKIRLKGEKTPGFMSEFFEKLKYFALRPDMAVAALTLIVGFLLGRALPPDQGTLTSSLIDRISSIATENINLKDVQRSPIIYSNVQYKNIDDNLVHINLDATTHLDFTRKKDDPLVHDIMAQTLLSSSNIGSELKAISYTNGIIDPKLKEALIFSMLNTPVLAIRMKAMSGLMEYKFDNDIKDAFLKVLKEEESVKMRLTAIDYLTNAQVSPNDLEQAINESEVFASPAVMIKMRNYIEK